jgi:hypothetical protein
MADFLLVPISRSHAPRGNALLTLRTANDRNPHGVLRFEEIGDWSLAIGYWLLAIYD